LLAERVELQTALGKQNLRNERRKLSLDETHAQVPGWQGSRVIDDSPKAGASSALMKVSRKASVPGHLSGRDDTRVLRMTKTTEAQWTGF